MTTIQQYLSNNRESVPGWMKKWSETEIDLPADFVIDNFLKSRTLFYPGSGYDGHPVKLFNQSESTHSFIYVDYGLRRECLEREIASRGFSGYESVKVVSVTDLANEISTKFSSFNGQGRSVYMESNEVPYAFINLFRRRSDVIKTHGAEMFCILFIYGDGHTAYDVIYRGRNGVRRPFAVVLQDHGFGGNWASFGLGGPMQKVAANYNCLPNYLLVAQNTTVWPRYTISKDESGTMIENSRGGMHLMERTLWEICD